MAEKKEGVQYLDETQIKALVQSVVPQGVQERINQLQKEHQSNYREHDDVVAVLDVSSTMLAEIDGIPGYLDVPTGKPAPGETVARHQAQFTQQGLLVSDRYKVVINFLPAPERKYEFTLVPINEWEEYARKQGGSFGLNSEQKIASFMLRAGAAEQ
jgi:hypothetical protein